MKRRSFLKAALSAAPLILPTTAFGRHLTAPSDKINLGFIGVGGMGTCHLRSFLGFEDVRITAVCDVRSDRRQQASERVNDFYGKFDNFEYLIQRMKPNCIN